MGVLLSFISTVQPAQPPTAQAINSSSDTCKVGQISAIGGWRRRASGWGHRHTLLRWAMLWASALPVRLRSRENIQGNLDCSTAWKQFPIFPLMACCRIPHLECRVTRILMGCHRKGRELLIPLVPAVQKYSVPYRGEPKWAMAIDRTTFQHSTQSQYKKYFPWP